MVPFALLVPVFGMSSAALLLGERVTPLGLLAAALLIGGVALTTFGGRWRARRRPLPEGAARSGAPV